MRLTNVAHLRLPFGPLSSYAVTVGEPGEAWELSADQARHIGEGPRAGSWMALAFTWPTPVDPQRLADAWQATVARHPTLRTVTDVDDDGATILRTVPVLGGQWTRHTVATGQSPQEAVREILDAACSPEQRPAHRLCTIDTMDGTTVVLGIDHSHVDMWSFMVILQELWTRLETSPTTSSSPTADTAAALSRLGEEAPGFEQHTRERRCLPHAAPATRQRWHAILDQHEGHFPVFPLPLGTQEPVVERVVLRTVLGVEDSAALRERARARKVSALSLVVAAMTEATAMLSDRPFAALFPIHTRHAQRWHASVGWFTLNSLLAPASAAPEDAAAAIREAIALGQERVEDIEHADGGQLAVPGLFAVSWLDLRRLPVQVDTHAVSAELISARIHTDGVMLWFISDASGLHLRCRFPDTAAARESVTRWLDEVVTRTRRMARSGHLTGTPEDASAPTPAALAIG
ncbi:MAG: peptide synthetase [Micrococcus sp.]|nr:peptide synthetase [Micrococcus sp.]